MKLNVESLETREVPSANLLANGTLVVNVETTTVSIDRDANNDIVVTEGDTAKTVFDDVDVKNVSVYGQYNARNVIQNNTNLDFKATGGDKRDTIFGGTGNNLIKPGRGEDVVYALLGTSVIGAKDSSADKIFTNANSVVNADAKDTVVRFFKDGRTPGSGIVQLVDNVLYITPTNNGSYVHLNEVRGGTLVRMIYDLGDGAGRQVMFFNKTSVKAISYFGGAGADVFVNDTTIINAAYGSAGDDVMVGGRGAYSLMKGSGGDDTLIGRATMNDLSGNGGSDVLILTNQLPGDIIRYDAFDTLIGVHVKDIRITP